jgi:hypothetical protein
VVFRKLRYSPEAYVRWRRRLLKALRFGIFWHGGLGVLSGVLVWGVLEGGSYAVAAAVVAAVFLLGLLSGALRLLELAWPNLMPYFSAPVPGNGLCIGYKLLRHSRALDALAESKGLRRVGSFVSDDDLFDGSGPTWHSASEALATFAGLLEHFSSHPSVQSARKDLEHLRERLSLAAASDAKFCLLVRDTHFTSAREWGARKGHC